MTTSEAPVSTAEFQRTPYVAWAGQVLCIVIPVAIWFAPLGLAAQVQRGLAILAFYWPLIGIR